MLTAVRSRHEYEYAHIAVRRLSGTLGAEITGVDLARPMDAATFAEVLEAFHRHLVIVAPGQRIAPEQLVAFTERFGPVEGHPLGSRRGLEDHPQVMVLENRPDGSDRATTSGTPTSLTARRRPWGRCFMPSRSPKAVAIRCSATCTRPTRDCRTV